MPRSLWEAYAGRSATSTPAPTSAAWWHTTSTPRSSSGQESASRTSRRWVSPGGAARAMRLLQHQVDPDHLVAVVLERGADRAADEPGRAGEQDLHGGPGIS